MTDERMLTVAEIVELLQVHEQTVRRWIKSGELRAIILGRKSGYRVRESDLRAFLEARETSADPKAAATGPDQDTTGPLG